jgi:hypothetical protein
MTTKEIKDLIKYHEYMMTRIGSSEAYKNKDLITRDSYTSHHDKRFALQQDLRALGHKF